MSGGLTDSWWGHWFTEVKWKTYGLVQKNPQSYFKAISLELVTFFLPACDTLNPPSLRPCQFSLICLDLYHFGINLHLPPGSGEYGKLSERWHFKINQQQHLFPKQNPCYSFYSDYPFSRKGFSSISLYFLKICRDELNCDLFMSQKHTYISCGSASTTVSCLQSCDTSAWIPYKQLHRHSFLLTAKFHEKFHSKHTNINPLVSGDLHSWWDTSPGHQILIAIFQ